MSWIDAEGHEHLSWKDIRLMTRPIAEWVRNVPGGFDVYLVITRGGMVLGCLLSEILNHKQVLTACVEGYGPDGEPLEHPIVHLFPAEPQLQGRRVLIVDDVWDRGVTIKVAEAKVRHVGATPIIVTLHYKPQRSKVEGKPDFYAAEVDRWIVYPWEEDDQLIQVGMPVRLLPAYPVVVHTLTKEDFIGRTLRVESMTGQGVILRNGNGQIVQSMGSDFVCDPAWLERAD